MRITKTLTAALAVLTLTASLTGCQATTQTVQEVFGSADQRQASTEPVAASSTDERAAADNIVQVLRVIDGDTIAVTPTSAFPATNGEGTEHSIRLLGIDTPELNAKGNKPPECGALEALNRLVSILLVDGTGAWVQVTYDDKADRYDRYGRSLAYVEIPDGATRGTDVGLTLAAEGLAEAWYPRGEPRPTRFAGYKKEQQAAEANSLGSYADCNKVGR